MSRDVPQRQQTDPVATTFFELLSQLHQEEYTGAVVLHFAHGQPKKAERAQPTAVLVGDGQQVTLR